MRPPPSSLRDSAATALTYCAAAVLWAVARGRDAVTWMWRTLRTLTTRGRTNAQTALADGRRVLGGPLRRAVTGPVRTALLGRRPSVSLLAGLLAAPLALGSSWWVSTNVGYQALVDLVTGTWYGTAPHLGVFLTLGVLVGLGATSAGLNSGLLPTTGLVVAPIFGAALTRYGTTVTAWDGGTTVVSLPEAVAYAAYVGVAFGVPIAVAGFLLGAGLRRVGTVLTDAGSPSRPTEQA